MASSTTGVWEDDTRTALIESMEKTQRAASLREIEKTQGKSTHSPPRFRVRPAPRFLPLRRARRGPRIGARKRRNGYITTLFPLRASVGLRTPASHCSNFALGAMRIDQVELAMALTPRVQNMASIKLKTQGPDCGL